MPMANVIRRWKDLSSQTIVLYDARRHQHILMFCPEMAENIDAIELALTDPDCVMKDADFDDRRNYYRLGAFSTPPDGQTYSKVCVDFPKRMMRRWRFGSVVTAYSAGKPKPG
jgi:hypothetical protein